VVLEHADTDETYTRMWLGFWEAGTGRSLIVTGTWPRWTEGGLTPRNFDIYYGKMFKLKTTTNAEGAVHLDVTWDSEDEDFEDEDPHSPVPTFADQMHHLP
jgi:hypothetical protein